jgi:hypothetical protein
LNLNQRVAVGTPFIWPEAWAACAREPIGFAGKPVYAAIDLSESGDLTALVVAHLDSTGVWQCERTSTCRPKASPTKLTPAMRHMICG